MSTSKTLPTNEAQKQLPPSTTNGVEKNSNTSKIISTDFTPPFKKKEEAPDLKPLEDRVHIIQKLMELVERRDKLLEAKQKLNAFKLSTDGLRDKLGINDGKGNEFLTSNTAVIKDVIETLKTSIQAKLDDVEKQIVF